MTTLTERFDKLPPTRRKKVEARASELIAEEMSLFPDRPPVALTGLATLDEQKPTAKTRI